VKRKERRQERDRRTDERGIDGLWSAKRRNTKDREIGKERE
jgi:hypothetical protein